MAKDNKTPSAAAKKISKKSTKKTTKKTSTKSTKAKNKTTETVENRIEQLQDLLQENLTGINTDKAEALAKNIWLAGLGAYSRTFEELSERVDDLQERYESINSEGQKVFEELVERGGGVQGELEKAMKKGRDSLEDRVEDFKKRFGGGLSTFVDIPAKLRDAAEKIEELGDKLKK